MPLQKIPKTPQSQPARQQGVAKHSAPAHAAQRPALWQQLQHAARLVQAVMQGSSAPTVLDELPSALRAGVQALGYQALRRLGMARWLREQLVPRTPPPAVDALLCTVLALAWDAKNAPGTQAPGAAESADLSAGSQPPSCADSAASHKGRVVCVPTDASMPELVQQATVQTTNRGATACHAASQRRGLAAAVQQKQAHQPSGAAGHAHAKGEQAALAMPGSALQYNDFTLVHQAVEAARRHPRMRHQSGLINACLRAFMREREAWQVRCHQAAPQGRAELLNLPAWWWQRLRADYPEPVDTTHAHTGSTSAADHADSATDSANATGAACAGDGSKESSTHPLASAAARPQQQPMSTAAAIALAGQHQPPMHLRVNARCLSPAQYLQAHLLPAGLVGQLHGDYGVMLHKPCPVQQLPGFAQGWVSVQDAAAQLAAPLLLQALQAQLDTKAGAKAGADTGTRLRLLDACAAPGGKTAHLLELGAHEVTALDIDAERCMRITENLQRLGLHAQVLAADAGQPAAWWNGQPFDGILLDAPCSASGIVRRHPDIAWLRREADIAQLAHTQQQLLHALWPLLRPGGVLLYATCSVFRAEGRDQIDAFLARHSDAASLPAPGHLLPANGLAAAGLGHNGSQAWPQASECTAVQSLAQAAGAACAAQWLDHDGFYYALLAKTV